MSEKNLSFQEAKALACERPHRHLFCQDQKKRIKTTISDQKNLGSKKNPVIGIIEVVVVEEEGVVVVAVVAVVEVVEAVAVEAVQAVLALLFSFCLSFFLSFFLSECAASLGRLLDSWEIQQQRRLSGYTTRPWLFPKCSTRSPLNNGKNP